MIAYRFVLSVTWLILFTASIPSFAKERPKFRYGYNDREHTLSEDLTHIGILYAASWGTYYLSQPETFVNEGSWSRYKDNFGEVVWDKDEPVWNWVTHPFSGSQLYLYFRANGYDRLQSLKMAFIQSTLFEFTVEVYTEPASIPDLFQTPVLGSILGFGLERLSLNLLNADNRFLNILGHVINPWTLFWFYEGKVQIGPRIENKKLTGLNLYVSF